MDPTPGPENIGRHCAELVFTLKTPLVVVVATFYTNWYADARLDSYAPTPEGIVAHYRNHQEDGQPQRVCNHWDQGHCYSSHYALGIRPSGKYDIDIVKDGEEVVWQLLEKIAEEAR